MLILHPSSRCDVCLEAYTWDIPTQMPHAIPCGHIFCKICLVSITSENCPLCRKPFFPNRVVKLHIDRPPTSEQGLQEFELLQKLAAEEAKLQADLEAVVKQSKQRKRELQEALERARLRQQCEERIEARRRPPSAEKGAAAAPTAFSRVAISRDSRDDNRRLLDNFPRPPFLTRAVNAVVPPTPLLRPEVATGGSSRARREARHTSAPHPCPMSPRVNDRSPRPSSPPLFETSETPVPRLRPEARNARLAPPLSASSRQANESTLRRGSLPLFETLETPVPSRRETRNRFAPPPSTVSRQANDSAFRPSSPPLFETFETPVPSFRREARHRFAPPPSMNSLQVNDSAFRSDSPPLFVRQEASPSSPFESFFSSLRQEARPSTPPLLESLLPNTQQEPRPSSPFEGFFSSFWQEPSPAPRFQRVVPNFRQESRPDSPFESFFSGLRQEASPPAPVEIPYGQLSTEEGEEEEGEDYYTWHAVSHWNS